MFNQLISRRYMEIMEFLDESNKIEGVYSKEALQDATRAWLEIEEKKTLTHQDILDVHKYLMRNLRPDIAGMWRNVPVRIGGHIKNFVSVQLIEEELKEVLRLVNFGGPGNGPEGMAKHAHVMFEHIHPFEDGNGRVGRILYNWHRLKLGLPIHIIHEGQEQMDYYQWFKDGYQEWRVNGK